MKKLERSLGLGAVVSISVSSMLGSGIFVLPGVAIVIAGNAVWLAYLLAAISVLPAALSKSELATAMPTSGGTYVYLERTFGPIMGTVAGLGLWLSLLLKSAFALMGFGAYLSVLAPHVDLKQTSLFILAFIVVINILGVGKVSSLIIIVVVLCLVTLSVVGIGGVIQIEPEALLSLFPPDSSGLVAGTALVFVSYAGVTKVAAIAEEIKNPEKTLPQGIMLSLLAVSFIYVFVAFVLVALLPISELSGNLKPIYLLAKKVGGDFLGFPTAIIAIITMSAMANSGILAASRFPFAMSRDKLIPSDFGLLHKKFLTPIWSIVLSGVVVAIAIVQLDVTKIAKFASCFMLMIYLMENLAVILLRETRVQWYRPAYKSPLYPFMQIFGILITAFLLVGMGGTIILNAILSIAIPGLMLFVFYSRKRTNRKGVIGIRGKRQDLVEEKMELIPRSRLESMDLTQDANVVVTLFGKERSPEMLIEMGVALAEHGNCEVAHITEVPEQTDLDDMMDEPAELRSLRRRVLAMAVEKKEPITFDPVVSHDIAKTIFHISQRLHCQWLLIEWRGKTAGAFTFHNPMGWLKGHLHCNLGIFRDVGVRYIRKIMCYIRADENDQIVINTADHFAEVNKADITLIKWVPLNTSEENKQKALEKINELAKKCNSRTNVKLITGKKVVPSIVTETVEYDLFIFGGQKHTFMSNFRGTDEDSLMAKAACSVISVQSAPDEDPETNA
jgi:basic amino acid/polyamine antiporter, APA family